jgi:hypothetical protein
MKMVEVCGKLYFHMWSVDFSEGNVYVRNVYGIIGSSYVRPVRSVE